MAKRLRSFVAGRWQEGDGEPTPLYNPTTEEVLATTTTQGIDLAAGLDFARAHGGPALRELSFRQRGQLLARAADAIHERREELVELAIAQGGNTRGDAKFDIDGATQTMSFYARLGEELGDERFLVEDIEPVQLGRSPRLVGSHVLVSRTGVAVHVNAFNFPAWGFGEKMAVALLAGMPVVTKPATATAMVAERIVDILVTDAVLPAGALSLVCGGAGELLAGLGGQDALAFTGSSVTAQRLRAMPNLIAGAVPINVEADSLNSAVLGPDVLEGSATFDLFLREVAKDVTQKAGQKCTAIRRVFVPRALLEPARAALIAEIGAVQVGDPSLREVRMGPLATADQLRDARAGVAALRAGTRVLLGDGGRGRLVGIRDEKGYFMSPVLLEAEDAAAAARVHELEVFGPVATILPYDGSAAAAAALVNRGGGGLVASVYTDDKDFAAAVVMAIAPFHGRVNIGSDKVAEHSMGPGTVLPQLVHGGPGRAGGGEELGGRRGLEFYMQRTAIQGLKPLLQKILAGGAGSGPPGE